MIKSLLLPVIILLSNIGVFAQNISHTKSKVIIIMMDGFGIEYYRSANMPTLNEFEKRGIYKEVKSLMPSVTNLNNAAICTGVFPIDNGITGNSYFDTLTNKEEFMEDANLILAPTIFQKAKQQGIESILFASKKKQLLYCIKELKTPFHQKLQMLFGLIE